MMFREKQDAAEALVIRQEASPAQPIVDQTTCVSHGLLTPPASNRKFLDNNYTLDLELGQTSGQKTTKK